MKDKNIKILVAAHKKYIMPKSKMYIPVHAGREGKKDLGYTGDNTGDNISVKNPNFCELTVIYWAWKNLDCDYIGLNHYRRYFTTKKISNINKKSNKFDFILTKQEVQDLLKKYDIITTNKQKLYFKNVLTKYAQQHHVKDLLNCGKIIEKKYPEYKDAFDIVMKSKEYSICNMFIMSKENLDKYALWLFDILFELEKQTDISEYTPLQKRIYGFLSERLFNVWLEHNKDLKVCYLPILNMEHDSIKVLAKKVYKRVLRIRS
jgi:hypothetical protein